MNRVEFAASIPS